MSKFSRFLSKCTSLVLTTILLFTSVQLPVFAEEENSQTGSTFLTETGFTLLEEQETDTGASVLTETESGTGREVEMESEQGFNYFASIKGLF